MRVVCMGIPGGGGGEGGRKAGCAHGVMWEGPTKICTQFEGGGRGGGG